MDRREINKRLRAEAAAAFQAQSAAAVGAAEASRDAGRKVGLEGDELEAYVLDAHLRRLASEAVR